MKFYDPQPYIDRYKKPNALQRKWPKTFRLGKSFVIDATNLEIVNNQTLFDTLDDYSIKAIELEDN